MADITATHSTGKDDWETPEWFIRLLKREFGYIDLDPCATAESTKAPIFFTEKENGLVQPWFGTVFVNPPYSQMAKWAAKAYSEAKMGHTKNILFLCAARTDTCAWWDYLRWGDVRFIKGRLKFVGAKSSAPFPSALVIFRHNLSFSSTNYWDIPKEIRKDE